MFSSLVTRPLSRFLNYERVSRVSRIVAQVNSRVREVIMCAAQLLIVETLKRLIVHAADSVAVRQHRVTIVVFGYFDHVRFADAAKLQQYSATNNFGIFFFTTEASQEGHELWRTGTGSSVVAQFRQSQDQAIANHQIVFSVAFLIFAGKA